MIFQDGLGIRSNFYHSYSKFLKEKFNEEVYKISLATGGTCPNRDGTKGYGGCIYCSSFGSGKETSKSIKEQVDLFLSNVKKGKKFIAYFQSFSNMYKNKDWLIEQIDMLASYEKIVGISIATRPDTVDDEILDYLKDKSSRFFIQIELGLESSNDITLQKINRKDESKTFLVSCERIKEKIPESHLVAHVIIGLPDENFYDFENTVKFFLLSKSDGIKFHHLYIVRDALIYNQFENGKVKLLSEMEYIDIFLELLKIIPPEKIIHRVKSSMIPINLVAPLWTMDRFFYEKLFKRAKEKRIFQGMNYGNNYFNCWQD
ncbi:TPA: TIGR01212 family radical SAM protein [candidate division WOR-3]|uniref:TIGR01212 family radical SAM protein n=2 Tax=Bacteria candidate phyla TaxID=1783234 RepID=A0A348MKY4_UNCW3|nr:TIGR01212 family radical SAM protein [candidate division WOR-3 bacterium]HCP17114.1 TIGR01212 family radical SAM protein [candidate division WOR-3 bacterium]